MPEISEAREQQIYDIILRMVLWDEKREDIFQKLAAAGFSEEKAQAVYARARTVRVAAIRWQCVKALLVGFLWLAGGGGYVLVLGEGIDATGKFGVFMWVIAVFGAYKVIKALVGIGTAHLKTGSLADED